METNLEIRRMKDNYFRYILVDKFTGNIIDDAQGYGFKTPEKAIQAFKYKSGIPLNENIKYTKNF